MGLFSERERLGLNPLCVVVAHYIHLRDLYETFSDVQISSVQYLNFAHKFKKSEVMANF